MKTESLFLIGDFGPAQLGASYRDGFQSLGVQVTGFDTSTTLDLLAWPGRDRLLQRATRGSLWARRIWAGRLNRAILDAASTSPSRWVLVLKGHWLMPETVHALRRLGKRVAIFHPDNPFPPSVANHPETLPAALEADLYLVWSQRLAHRLQAFGVKRAAFLPFGWDPAVFPFQSAMPQGQWPGVLFIGGWDPEREAFLDELSSLVPLRIYGPGYWGTRSRAGSRARACWMGREITASAAAQAIRESAVSLNVLRTQHIIDGVPDGVIMRHFEVPGAGGFLLSTRSGGALDLFPEGTHAAYFSDIKECVDTVGHYLRHPEARRQIVSAAHTETAAKHTYVHRAAELIAHFDGFD